MFEFKFENTVTITEAQYVAIWSMLPKRPWFKYVRFMVLVAVGLACLLSKYTLLIGLGLLALAVMAIVLPRAIMPSSSRSIYRRHVYLREPLTYGVSEEKMWARGSRIDASAQWSLLVTWREIEGWLLLSASGIPPVYLSLARLREEGLYDRVSDMAQRYGTEFNKARPGKH